jgi:putative ABC transport system permease protein
VSNLFRPVAGIRVWAVLTYGRVPGQVRLGNGISRRRKESSNPTLYALIPLFLAAIGLYGLLAFMIRQRFREIGIRVALGADPGAIRSLILRQGLGLVGLGLPVGFAGALGMTRLIRNQLFGVGPADPVTFVVVGLGVALVALAACLLPVRQALRIDPNTALRVE